MQTVIATAALLWLEDVEPAFVYTFAGLASAACLSIRKALYFAGKLVRSKTRCEHGLPVRKAPIVRHL
jgi:hypothetical protein